MERAIMAERCTAHKHNGERCGNWPIKGKRVCRFHGGTNNGRPVIHALYSKSIPAEWVERYEYFKRDPDYLSLRAEIALAQTNMDRFLDLCDGKKFDGELRGQLTGHLEHIGRLKEKEGKRVYNERLISELMAKQVQEEARILAEVLNKHVDGDSASRIAAEFADALGSASGIEPSLSVNTN